MVWGQVAECYQRPTAYAKRLVAARRERAEVVAAVTALGREW